MITLASHDGTAITVPKYDIYNALSVSLLSKCSQCKKMQTVIIHNGILLLTVAKLSLSLQN